MRVGCDILNIKQIAELAGVSVATVSNVLNNNDAKVSKEVKARVLQIIEENHYVPNSLAKGLRKQKTNTIGVITEDITQFQTPKILTGINNIADKKHYKILLYDLAITSKIGTDVNKIMEYREEIDEALNTLLEAKVEGIIYVAWQDRDIEDLIREVEVPVVYAYCYSASDKRSWVSYDNVHIMEEIMNNVLSLGHRNIALAWGGEVCRPAQQRLNVYRMILEKKGIPYREDYTRHGDWSFEDGREFYHYYVNLEEPPTVLLFMNDEMAAGAVHESMQTDQKVLNEVSVVGFNNLEYAWFCYPAIASVSLPLEEIGKNASKILLKQIKGKNDSYEKIILDCKFIKRQSLHKNILK